MVIGVVKTFCKRPEPLRLVGWEQCGDQTTDHEMHFTHKKKTQTLHA